MPPKPKKLTTAADELYELVRRGGELSFKEAAKRLKVPLATIEAWATFLEEDGLLALKYKLTTPYLTMPPATEKKPAQKMPKLFQDKLAEAEVKSELEHVSELMSRAEEKREQGEFAVLGELYEQLLQKLRKIASFVSTKTELSPQKKSQLNEEIAEIEAKITQATQLASKGKFDSASASYEGAHKNMQAMLLREKSYYSEAKESDETGEEGIKKMLGKAYELLRKGRLEEATEEYEKIKRTMARFSQKYIAERKSLQDKLLKLNKDMAIQSTRIRNERMQYGTEKLNKLTKAANENIAVQKFTQAAAHYKEIKKTFEALPEGFEKEKLTLKAGILKVYARIAKEAEKRAEARFKRSEKEIKDAMRQALQSLEKGKPGEAFRLYRQASEEFQGLPQGFAKEKLELQNLMLPLYRQVTQKLENKAEQEMAEKGSRIMQLLSQMEGQTRQQNFAAAERTYHAINQLFASLPEGFAEKRTAMQEKTIDAYEELIRKKNKNRTGKFNSSTESLDQLIGEAEKSIKQGDYMKAKALYKRIKESYANLPPVNPSQRQEIRNRILLLYRRITMVGSAPMKNTQPNTGIHEKIAGLRETSRATVKMPKVKQGASN